MTEEQKALIRAQYELLVELFDSQGDEIDALQRANASLRRSHEIIGKLLKITGNLMGVN